VTNSCGVTITDSVFIGFKPLPVLAVTANDYDGCVPFTTLLTDASTTTTDSIVSWQWSFGDGQIGFDQNPSHTYTTVGTYPITLSVVTSGGCTASSAGALANISVHEIPDASFTATPTTVFLPNDPVSITNTSVGATSYLWNFGDGSTSVQAEPQYYYTQVGTYNISLVATNSFGCIDTASQEVIASSDIVFPNAFTPDPSGPNGGGYNINDLTNDVFFPFTAGVVEFHLMIFNRWGELIFETFDINQGWDGYYRGKMCPQDVYVWKAFAKFYDNRAPFNKTGDVTLLR
jgi:gliding motility-associated-like protein